MWTRTTHESFTHGGDRAGLGGDEHADECRHRTRAFHAFQLVKSRRLVDTNGLHHMEQVQVLDSDWFKTDHRAVFAVLSMKPKMRYTMKNGGNLCGWEPDEAWLSVAAETLTDWENWNAMVPLLMETAMAHRKVETKEMSVTEMELKSLLLKKKKTGRHLERTELKWLCREIWRKRRALKREKHLDKIKESAEMGKALKKSQSKHFNWSSIAKDENPESVLTKILPRPLLDSGRPGGVNPIRETPLCRAVEKPENGCAGGMLFSPRNWKMS